MFLLLLIACSETSAGLISVGPTHFVLTGGQPDHVLVEDGWIRSVGVPVDDVEAVDVSGRWLVPSFIDSHVHLAYLPDAEGMALGGVAAAVDLAAPESWLGAELPIRVRASGPMVTGPGGYPTRSWGAGGYGRACADAEAAVEAVEALHRAGAGVLKLASTGVGDLPRDAMRAAAARAADLGSRTAIHALGDEEAALGAAVGADVLAHTPTGALEASTLDAWKDRAVISTLAAFGGGSAAVDNLRALHRTGATVLYGTDFGNRTQRGIDPDELALLAEAGLGPAEILASGTEWPAAFWGFEDLGAVASDKRANLLVLDTDPLEDITVLARPEHVYLDGRRLQGRGDEMRQPQGDEGGAATLSSRAR